MDGIIFAMDSGATKVLKHKANIKAKRFVSLIMARSFLQRL